MIMEGLLAVMQPYTIALVAVGVVVGIIFGSIPGLTATMAIVMFLPVTYAMQATEGISMLVALYIGGISGGLISAILLNIPGTPSSVATCFDGKPLADKGQAAKALGVGVVFSFVGTIIGIALLVWLTPVLCDFALKFQAYEYCSLAIFSLSMVHCPHRQGYAQGSDLCLSRRPVGNCGPGSHRLPSPFHLWYVPAEQRLCSGGSVDRPVCHLRGYGLCRNCPCQAEVYYQ